MTSWSLSRILTACCGTCASSASNATMAPGSAGWSSRTRSRASAGQTARPPRAAPKGSPTGRRGSSRCTSKERSTALRNLAPNVANKGRTGHLFPARQAFLIGRHEHRGGAAAVGKRQRSGKVHAAGLTGEEASREGIACADRIDDARELLGRRLDEAFGGQRQRPAFAELHHYHARTELQERSRGETGIAFARQQLSLLQARQHQVSVAHQVANRRAGV